VVNTNIRSLFSGMIAPLLFSCLLSCGDSQTGKKGVTFLEKIDSVMTGEAPDEYNPDNVLLILPGNPAPGECFRILATGGRNIRKAKIVVSGPSGNLESLDSKTGEELPCWRIDDFAGIPAGNYKATLVVDKKEVSNLEFEIAPRKVISQGGVEDDTCLGAG
jgi:hypothetical protein